MSHLFENPHWYRCIKSFEEKLIVNGFDFGIIIKGQMIYLPETKGEELTQAGYLEILPL